MDIKVVASGSKGNCYIIHGSKSKLILECGINIKEIKKALDFDLSNVCGCLVTHEHKDHSKAINNIMKNGITVFTSVGTAEVLSIEEEGINSYRLSFAKDKEQFKLKEFIILPFETEHDAAEPLGFLIQDTITGEKLLFATDTYYIKYKFKGINYIMIECNYDLEILNKNIEKGLIPESLKNRILESHFGLENVKEFLMANDLSQVLKIYLIHLSDGNSDADRFKREIEELTGIETIIAE